MQTLAPSEFKNCCATLYEDKALQFLLGPSLHPGGLGLTRRLADRMRLSSADTVLDAACGLGESTRFLAEEYGCTVFGLDLSRTILDKTVSKGDTRQPSFLVGDGEQLPFKDNTFSAAISECSLCLTPDSRSELREISRSLRSNGKIGITDIVTMGKLPSELEEVLMRFLCISTSSSVSAYQRSLELEGFERIEVSDESQSLRELLETIKKRLLLAELLTSVGKLSIDRAKLDHGKRLVSLSRSAVDQKRLGYAMITAQKPTA